MRVRISFLVLMFAWLQGQLLLATDEGYEGDLEGAPLDGSWYFEDPQLLAGTFTLLPQLAEGKAIGAGTLWGVEKRILEGKSLEGATTTPHYKLSDDGKLFVFYPSADVEPNNSDDVKLVTPATLLSEVVQYFMANSNEHAVGYFPLILMQKTWWTKQRRHWVLLKLDRATNEAVITDSTQGFKALGYNNSVIRKAIEDHGFESLKSLTLGHQGTLNLHDCGWYVLAYIKLVAANEPFDQEKVEATKHELISEFGTTD